MRYLTEEIKYSHQKYYISASSTIIFKACKKRKACREAFLNFDAKKFVSSY